MKKIGKVLMIMFVLLFVSRKVNAAQTTNNVIKTLSNGWNLVNYFDTNDSNQDRIGNPITAKETIHEIKMKGFESIHIPVNWEAHMNDLYEIDEYFFKRLDAVIDYALKENLSVVINMEQNNGQEAYDWNDIEYVTMFETLWTQIATHYKDYSDRLIYQAIEAPYCDDISIEEQGTRLKEMYEKFINIVRMTGGNNGNRTLLLSPLYGQIDDNSANQLRSIITQLKDDHIAVSFQYFGLWEFSVNCNNKRKFDHSVQHDIDEVFRLVKNQFLQHNIAAVCTEYGLLGLNTTYSIVDYGEALKYFEYLNYVAYEYGVPIMLWDDEVLWDSREQAFRQPDFCERLQYVWNQSDSKRILSSYSDSDSIYINVEEELKEQTIGLTLNENQFVQLKDTTGILVEGTDYKREGNLITLLTGYLERKLGEMNGVIETIDVYFNQGLPWQIQLIQCGTPLLLDQVGNLDEFSIPVDFQGNRVVSIASSYVDNQVAGPIDWTKYQEMGYCYHIDYEQGVIELTKEYLDSLSNKTVMFDVSFESGDKVVYYMNKEDDIIISSSFFQTFHTDQNIRPKVKNDKGQNETVVAVTNQEDSLERQSKQRKVMIGIIGSSIILSSVILILYIYYRKKQFHQSA